MQGYDRDGIAVSVIKNVQDDWRKIVNELKITSELKLEHGVADTLIERFKAAIEARKVVIKVFCLFDCLPCAVYVCMCCRKG